jgi:hypothetical protein
MVFMNQSDDMTTGNQGGLIAFPEVAGPVGGVKPVRLAASAGTTNKPDKAKRMMRVLGLWNFFITRRLQDQSLRGSRFFLRRNAPKLKHNAIDCNSANYESKRIERPKNADTSEKRP